MKHLSTAYLIGALLALSFGDVCRLARAQSEAAAQEKSTSPESTTKPQVKPTRFASVEALAEAVRESIVEVRFLGRDGNPVGLGTGFVVSTDGIIATNLHVIGEARPIQIRFANGQEHPVKIVQATDPTMDLALLKIDAEELSALELGDSDKLKQGQQVVAIGNPKGLRHSVVSGVVSGRRELDGKPMLQLAIPIEEGNSGGPVLDLDGRVHGIVTLKSLVTPNLGYAVAINALKGLISRPNPIPMKRWLTVGTLDPKQWKTTGDADWKQRAGRIRVSGSGGGFGGRALCLSNKKTPGESFEVAVDVKLDDERGAAGLVFHADGANKHYGFYPTQGQLRLTRFDGPTVFSWNVLSTVRSRHYRAGEWNSLRVRVSAGRIECFVNDQLVIESADAVYGQGQIGLAKFRDTRAEFKRFRTGTQLPTDLPNPDVVAAILKMTADIAAERPPTDALIRSVLKQGTRSPRVLEQQAKRLEKKAQRLRQLAAAVQLKALQKELLAVLEKDESEIDLLKAALLIAQIDNSELEVDHYLAEVGRIVEEIRGKLPKQADDRKRLRTMDEHLFGNLGFHGSRTQYYHRSNSYLNEVIDDREGLPISLSVLYIAIAAQLDIKMVGIGLPGHFVVRCEPQDGKPFLVDVFNGGKAMSRQDAETLVVDRTQAPFREEYLEPQTKRAILVRMLRNLQGVALRAEDRDALFRYVDTLVLLEPESGEHRWMRALLYLQTDRLDESIEDADWILDNQPVDIDRERVLELRRHLQSLK